MSDAPALAARESAFRSRCRELRGLKGREDSLARTRWAEPDELGKEWDYSSGRRAVFGCRKGRSVCWKDGQHALSVTGTRAGKRAS